jgi:hypothetical protein
MVHGLGMAPGGEWLADALVTDGGIAWAKDRVESEHRDADRGC